MLIPKLSDLVVELLQDKPRIEEMGASGLVYVRERFVAEKMLHQMESVLMATSKDSKKNRRRWSQK